MTPNSKYYYSARAKYAEVGDSQDTTHSQVPGGSVKLPVPVYLGGRPASSIFGPLAIATGGAPTGSTTIALSGSGVCSGTVGAGPTCTGTFPIAQASLVTPFELQAVNPRNPSVPAYADIQYAGVAFDPASGLLMFGISTWGNWSSPHAVAFNILIDPTSTGNFTRVLFNSDPGTMALNLFGTSGAGSQDSFITATFNTQTSGVSTQRFVNLISEAGADTGVFKIRVMILATTPASLGITGTSFHWKVRTTSGNVPLAALAGSFETIGPTQGFFWDRSAQGLNFSGGNLFFDLQGGSIPVAWNTANIMVNGSLGALLLHTHNVDGTQAQVIPLDTATGADIAVAQSASPSPMLNQNVTLTLTASNSSAITATGIAVSDLLPSGLTYVSDDSGGAYNPSIGTWTVGTLSASAVATLYIVATVATTDALINTAQRTASSPLDPNPANDIASVTIQAPREADLAVSATASTPTVAQGSNVTYNVTVNNLGNDPAYNVQLSEGFPSFPSLTPTSFTASAGVFNPATGV